MIEYPIVVAKIKSNEDFHFISGGKISYTTTTDAVQVYRGQTDTIESIYSPYPITACYICLVVIDDGNSLVGLGGYITEETATASVNLLDLNTGTWDTSAIPDLNKIKYNSYCALINGKLIRGCVNHFLSLHDFQIKSFLLGQNPLPVLSCTQRSTIFMVEPGQKEFS